MLHDSSAVPLYQQLKEQISEQIRTGVYLPGQRLPTEGQLAQGAGVSIITVRKALSLLAEQGVVVKKQGKGTFVSAPKYNREINNLLSFTQSCEAIGAKPGAQLLQKKVIRASGTVCRELGVPPGANVVLLSRLRFVNGEAMAVETTIFPREYRFLLRQRLNHVSMLELVRQTTGNYVARSDKKIEIVRADVKTAKRLNIMRNEPLLSITSTAYDQNGAPMFVGTQLINGERFQLFVRT